MTLPGARYNGHMMDLIPFGDVAADIAVAVRRGILSLATWSGARLLRAIAAGAEFLADFLDGQKKKNSFNVVRC